MAITRAARSARAATKSRPACPNASMWICLHTRTVRSKSYITPDEGLDPVRKVEVVFGVVNQFSFFNLAFGEALMTRKK